MFSYEDIGLNSRLQPVSAPISSDRGFVSGVTFDSSYERNVITSYAIKQTPWINAEDAATVILDLSKGNRQRVTIAGNRTLSIINATIGQTFLLRIQQDATGSRTITWFDTISWAGGGVPVLTTTANKADEFGFIITGDQTYDGFIIGLTI